jgi:hypothetical protein
MNKEDIAFLAQLIETLDELAIRLEAFYLNRDYSNYNKNKKLFIQIQKKIEDKLE